MAKLVLKNIRGSYVFINEPRKEKDGSDGKYSMQILISKDDPQIPAIKKAIKAAAQEKFGEKVKMGMIKLPLRDGDEEREEEEYAGMYFMNANAARKPGMVNKFNAPPTANDIEEYCFSGAYFHVSINLYAFNHEGKKGVAVGLNNVMLREKGERLDGTSSATSDFADFAESGDSDFDNTDDGDDW